MPYNDVIDKLAEVVTKEERQLFTSNTALIFYWIAERHNSERVMKQFGLRQLLPINLRMPFERVDRVRKATHDYSKSFKEVIAIWDARHKMILMNTELDDSLIHDEFYMKWYSVVTRLRISRPQKKEDDEDEMVPPTPPKVKNDDEFIHKRPVSDMVT